MFNSCLVIVIHMDSLESKRSGDVQHRSYTLLIPLASRSEVRGYDSGRGRWIFSERKNLEYDFLRKVSKAVGPVS